MLRGGHPMVTIVSNLNRFLMILVMVISLVGCGSIKEIPINTIEKVEYRDSVIFIKEIVEVEVPIEKIVYVGPSDTTSHIATSLAFSEAKISKGILTHTLEQKGSIEAKIDTVIKVQNVNKIIEKEVPIQVEVEKKYIPSWMWWSFIGNIIVILYLVFRIYLKIKGVA